MSGNILFYYFGDDESYFRTLQAEFEKSTRFTIDFFRFFESDEKAIQSFALKVLKDAPACVFIDLSKQTDDYLHLARLITRTPLEHKLITVGLVDYLSSPEIIIESMATKVNVTHIKGAEAYDVIFDVAKFLAPNEIKTHGFATTLLKETWEGGIPVKVGFVHPTGIHFETDYPVQKGEHLKLRNFWSEKKLTNSETVFIKNTSSKNLFYNFKIAVDAEFNFVDEFLPPEGMEPEKITEKQNERSEQILYYKKQLNKWVDTNLSSSDEKKAKILIVDRDMKFFDNQIRTDKHKYTVRCIPYIEDIITELDRLRPQVIAFAFENDVDGVVPKNTPDQLMRLIDTVKMKFSESKPFVIVFNCKQASREVQVSFNYNNIMSTNVEMSVELLIKMADLFEKKMDGLVKDDSGKDEKKVFISKTNGASVGELLFPFNIVKLSETDMIIQTDIPLITGTHIHFKTPIDMYVCVQPMKSSGKTPQYYGLIHSIGEASKKELRRFVNSVFFRDHDAQVAEELDDFKKLNQAKLQERREALKALMEKAEQERQEALAKNPENKPKD